MEREIVDYPNRTIECPECGGSAHMVVEKTENYEQEGYECDDCRTVIPP